MGELWGLWFVEYYNPVSFEGYSNKCSVKRFRILRGVLGGHGGPPDAVFLPKDGEIFWISACARASQTPQVSEPTGFPSLSLSCRSCFCALALPQLSLRELLGVYFLFALLSSPMHVYSVVLYALQ